jgi:hypothetical protein
MLSNNPLNMLHHTVALDWQRGKSIFTSHTIWLVDSNLYNLGYRNTSLQSSFGFAFKYMDHGKFDKRTHIGEYIGSYYPMDLKITTNYIYKFTPNFYTGLNVNVIYEKIDSASATGLTTDWGIAWLTPLQNTFYDVNIKNIGITSKMETEKVKLPFIMDHCITTGFEFSDQIKISPSFRISYMEDHNDLLPAFGVNAKVNDFIMLRSGYKFNYNEESLSFGFGLSHKSAVIDYSYVLNDIDSVHSIGIGWCF